MAKQRGDVCIESGLHWCVSTRNEARKEAREVCVYILLFVCTLVRICMRALRLAHGD